MPRSRAGARKPIGDAPALAKAPTGIAGLDEITGGGLPRGRTTLMCGGTGSGKTLLAMTFLVKGAVEQGEPGVFVAFEETRDELAADFASLGVDLGKLESEKRVLIDSVVLEPSEVEATGFFDLEGLFVRLEDAIDRVGARRLVLDGVETLFAGLPDPKRLRAELRRLLGWLKARGLTVVITGEKGEQSLSRRGFEEYVSDCVIVLDHRVVEQVSTRRCRIVKYRGSMHGTNEYPFLIDRTGITIAPITALTLAHEASTERISSGLERLDEMLGGKGYFRGSTVLASGPPGSGKTILAMHLVRAACERGERCLFFAMDESPEQLSRNMRSVGLDLEPYVTRGLLVIAASRPTAYGLEMHLATMSKKVVEHDPHVVLVDPVTSLLATGEPIDTQMMLTRLVDLLKNRGTTAFFTTLVGNGRPEATEVGLSSLIDTWLVLQIVPAGGERNRTFSIVKSRGMAHSNQSVEYRIDDQGVAIVDTYAGPAGVLTGSARVAKEAEDRAAFDATAAEIARKKDDRQRRRHAFERRLAELREEFEAEDAAVAEDIRVLAQQRDRIMETRAAVAQSRGSFAAGVRPARAPRRGRSR